jgi:hypothetical protein
MTLEQPQAATRAISGFLDGLADYCVGSSPTASGSTRHKG